MGQSRKSWCQGSVLRLQGFYDWQIDRIKQGDFGRPLYKQAGNGVTVDVIEAIGTLLWQADTEMQQGGRRQSAGSMAIGIQINILVQSG